MGRGGRRTGILLDEFAAVEEGYNVLAATRDTTDCRLFNSTPAGAAGAFYDVMQSRTLWKLRLHWPLHPRKAAGLYFDEAGRPRSPWYDLQCERATHPQEIARELDINYAGADFEFFEGELVDEVKLRDVTPPLYTGDLEYTTDNCTPVQFLENERGSFHLWLHPAADGRPTTEHQYVMGVDVATGTRNQEGRGASVSAISVGDCTTREKVAEFAISGLQPHLLARQAVAIAKWFAGPDGQGAYMAWEDNGPGMLFGQNVLELGYRHVYFRRQETRLKKRVTDVPGWWSTPETKRLVLGDYKKALVEGKFINRSQHAVEEMRFYVYKPTGDIVHSQAQTSIDPTGARHNHGDRVVADALCWMMMKAYVEVPPEPAEQDAPPFGSLAARRSERERVAQEREVIIV